MTSMPDFYTVKQHDTLAKIAEKNSVSVKELCKINGILDPNKIKIGQKIALKKELVCGVEFQFLDKDCNPLRDTKVKIQHGNTETISNTGKNGMPQKIVTESPLDIVSIYIQRVGGGWKKITSVSSDWGNKLVTLVSPKVKIETKTQPHPQTMNGKPLPDKNKKAPDNVKTPPTSPVKTTAKGKTQSQFGDQTGDVGIKAAESKDAAGLPQVKVTNDQAELPFLALYKGGKITETEWEELAKELSCEVNAAKAVTQVEAGGKGGFDAANRPVILFERHQFSKYSQRKFDKDYPYISSTKAYLRIRGKDKKIIPEREIEFKALKKKNELATSNYYPPDSNSNYVRLSKAYLLDKSAALKSASWGMFQVMGFNYATCGFKSVEAFVDAMATSEKEQVKAFASFIKANKKLSKAIKEKDWLTFAINYNGAQQEGYDVQMKNAYNTLSGKK